MVGAGQVVGGSRESRMDWSGIAEMIGSAELRSYDDPMTKHPFSRAQQPETSWLLDMRSLLVRAMKLPVKVDGLSLSLPFLGISVKPDDAEKKAAREIVIRLADKRVLNAFECCDGCIRNALASLQEIRGVLVEKQVALTDKTDSGLFLLCEMMLEAIRQFLTFTERRDPERHREDYLASPRSRRSRFRRSRTTCAMIRPGTRAPICSWRRVPPPRRRLVAGRHQRAEKVPGAEDDTRDEPVPETLP
ncbi:MAG: hypothetical protein A2506_11920 [Elusimicrobia bacterium RIFOXYD12_FULL_66_9]|nr:MAG: hypothetical protein A2506_11920 [Elusimicrobia bacterium RIFOXYD12_FULL_66_9]